MRTTITIDDDLYKKLVSESIEKYGSTRNLSALVNHMVKAGFAKPVEIRKPQEQKMQMPLQKGKIESYINSELEAKGGLMFALIDPIDYSSLEDAVRTAKNANEAGADVILIGGSTGVQGEILDNVTKMIKESVNVPVVLFPGNIGTVTKYADAVYFMSLLNSRNRYWISGAQLLAAPMVRQYKVEPLPVGYIVVEPGGTVGYVGEADLIPRERPKLAAAMALAAQYMGFRIVITDAGSNPKEGHIPLEMVAAVSKTIDVPYIVAGGIRTPEQAKNVIAAGGDIIQVGTAFEKSNSVGKIKEMVAAVREGAKLRK
jgi:phosphoglycerol geranylgeranyltransferase